MSPPSIPATKTNADCHTVPLRISGKQREALEVSPPSPVISSGGFPGGSHTQIPSDLRLSENDEVEGTTILTQTANESSPTTSTIMQFPGLSNGQPPSNKTLLCTAFVSFTTFATVQMFFAFLAGSAAMKGDSAAMVVDSMTYLFNWYAEVRKDRFDQEYMLDSTNEDSDPEHAERVKERQRRKLVLKLEIIPPVISVTTLIGVTIVVMKQAIEVLVLDLNREQSEQADPSLNLMMGFSVFNLGLDFMNVFCFARAKHLMGYETKEHHNHHRHGPSLPLPSAAGGLSPAHDSDEVVDDILRHQRFHERNECNCDYNFANKEMEGSDESDADGRGEANLNMCSAYTHVFADTLRSIAVILAALVAKLTPGITSEEADSAAAIAVSLLILMSLIPLFQGLYDSVMELRAIHAEEVSETYFLGDEEDGTFSPRPETTDHGIS